MSEPCDTATCVFCGLITEAVMGSGSSGSGKWALRRCVGDVCSTVGVR